MTNFSLQVGDELDIGYDDLQFALTALRTISENMAPPRNSSSPSVQEFHLAVSVALFAAERLNAETLEAGMRAPKHNSRPFVERTRQARA